MMVGHHASLLDTLFKKYCDDVGRRDQAANYKKRIKGADTLRTYIAERSLCRVVVPQKWLLKLPQPPFREQSFILAVERLDLLSKSETIARYHDLDEVTLRELCRCLRRFRGLDSSEHNVCLTNDGKVAFIDLEHWDHAGNREYLKFLGPLMSRDTRKRAARFLGGQRLQQWRR